MATCGLLHHFPVVGDDADTEARGKVVVEDVDGVAGAVEIEVRHDVALEGAPFDVVDPPIPNVQPCERQ